MMSDLPVTLLRATTLHAALLFSGAEILDVHSWRARCGTLVETLRQGMQDASYPAADIDEVSLVQCMLLDDLTLRVLSAQQRPEWLRESLQARFHGLHDGAARVWERIDVLLRDGCRDRGLLELYGIVLESSFDGGRGHAGTSLQRMKAAQCRIERGEEAESAPNQTVTVVATKNVAVPSRVVRTHWMAGVVVVAMIAVGALWLAFDTHLNAAIGRLPTATVAPAELVQKEGAS
ncbi:DotU family type IV/VI secretion system protein [Paraburkholderia antibiotica]|uniref:DotU family type IV/VI secretion system protein n=1 Tax=Paraburkholderia antibiotica TaxID=2728839 RepID=A0A7Y0FG29_9BURK|nr:DotU family type IV/VI secretion system protein [Paraburkholderia antibiotica]NML34742.1 DotU family type IV/VI secretion system protein [Paraburkholderia antibiotica]